MSPKKETQKSAKRTTAIGKKSKGFTDEERAAMKERARELKADAADGESAVLAKIAAMPEPDGMPAYAKDGKVVCYFQNAQKFKSRYATFGFSDKAHLDDGTLWPVAFALQELTPAAEAKIVALVKQAVR